MGVWDIFPLSLVIEFDLEFENKKKLEDETEKEKNAVIKNFTGNYTGYGLGYFFKLFEV